MLGYLPFLPLFHIILIVYADEKLFLRISLKQKEGHLFLIRKRRRKGGSRLLKTEGKPEQM
jgi:hypothetical protein